MSILSRVRAAGIGVPRGENSCESAIGRLCQVVGARPFLTEYITGSLRDLPPSSWLSRYWSSAMRANSCIVKVLGMKVGPLETA